MTKGKETLEEVLTKLEDRLKLIKDYKNHTEECPYFSDRNAYWDCSCGLVADDTLGEAIRIIKTKTND